MTVKIRFHSETAIVLIRWGSDLTPHRYVRLLVGRRQDLSQWRVSNRSDASEFTEEDAVAWILAHQDTTRATLWTEPVTSV